MYKHILIPTDGTELSRMAVKQGMALAKSLGAKVTVLTTFPTFHFVAVDPVLITATPATFRKDCEAAAERYLSAAADAAAAAGVACEGVHLEHDHPYEAIIDTAGARGCDLIFMASHGRKGVAAFVLGSETTKVLTHSKIPVLVCR
jgi:nucleotide-binding universal stress UspA family protein